MPDERRYDDTEAAEILAEAASEAPDLALAVSGHGGLTLVDLQAIGDEVGIAPDRIAQAARARDSQSQTVKRLGVPVAMRQTIPLRRTPTTAEWQVIVTELREICQTNGAAISHEGVFEWASEGGGTRVFIEPTPSGHRLRVQSAPIGAIMMGLFGTSGLLFSGFITLALTLSGKLQNKIGVPIIFSLVGLGAVVGAAIQIPAWLRQRSTQFEEIARRVPKLLEGDRPQDPAE